MQYDSLEEWPVHCKAAIFTIQHTALRINIEAPSVIPVCRRLIHVLVSPACRVSRRGTSSQRWRTQHRCDHALTRGQLTCSACCVVESRAVEWGGRGGGEQEGGSGGEDEQSSIIRFNYNLLCVCMHVCLYCPNHSISPFFYTTNSSYSFSWNFCSRKTNCLMPRTVPV
jgi:hypothetical protein